MGGAGPLWPALLGSGYGVRGGVKVGCGRECEEGQLCSGVWGKEGVGVVGAMVNIWGWIRGQWGGGTLGGGEGGVVMCRVRPERNYSRRGCERSVC